MSDAGHGGIGQGRWAWMLLALALILIPVAIMQAEPPAPPPVLGDAPNFTLVTHQDQPVSLDSFADQALVVDFIFTRCPDVCPMLSERLIQLQGDVPDGPTLPVRFLSISVDPEFDSPEVLASYASKFAGDMDRWVLATGPKADMEATLAGFQQGVSDAGLTEDGEVSIFHSQRFLLVDGQGRIRGFHSVDNAGYEALIEAIEGLRHELTADGAS